jgi:demethylmenaquinone methyltransferase/2-methoxy-6-polyprenyl-1,4-benzoquinol methylase
MSESSASLGLGEEWKSVEEALRRVVPVYDKTNRFISLGSDLKIRKWGLELLKDSIGRKVSDGGVHLLDLGCGTGKMSSMLASPTVMVDALQPMMGIALERNPSSDGILAVFERLPLRKETFQAAMAGFAIRDAQNLSQALREIHETLADDGHFLIVDLSKPDSRLKRDLIATYWRLFAPLIAFFAAGRLGFRFAALSKTYQKLPQNSRFLKLAQSVGFELEASKFFMLGGAATILLRKKIRSEA